jgi:hypothetical protein
MAIARDLGAPASWCLKWNGTLGGSLQLFLVPVGSVTRQIADKEALWKPLRAVKAKLGYNSLPRSPGILVLKWNGILGGALQLSLVSLGFVTSQLVDILIVRVIPGIFRWLYLVLNAFFFFEFLNFWLQVPEKLPQGCILPTSPFAADEYESVKAMLGYISGTRGTSIILPKAIW